LIPEVCFLQHLFVSDPQKRKKQKQFGHLYSTKKYYFYNSSFGDPKGMRPKSGRNQPFEKLCRNVTEVYVFDPFKVTSLMDTLKNLFQVDNKFRPLKEARIVSVTIHANPIAE